MPDIDECQSGIHNCLPDFICQNTLGSFRCRPQLQCKNGFIQDALGNCIGKTPSPGRRGPPGRAPAPALGRVSRTWAAAEQRLARLSHKGPGANTEASWAVLGLLWLLGFAVDAGKQPQIRERVGSVVSPEDFIYQDRYRLGLAPGLECSNPQFRRNPWFKPLIWLQFWSQRPLV